MTTRLPDARPARLVDLDAWGLLNLGVDEILALPTRLHDEYGIGADELDVILEGYSIQSIGLLELCLKHLPGQPAGVVIGPGTMHYSWPKAAALLGIGSEQLIRIPSTSTRG